MAKYIYKVSINRVVTSCGDFEVTSAKKLTEDEVLQRAMGMATEGDEPDSGWEETDTTYEDEEIFEGADDLKEE